MHELSLTGNRKWPVTAVVSIALLAPTFPTVALAQQAKTSGEPKSGATKEPTRGLLRQVLNEAVQDVGALKDARARAELFQAAGTTWAKLGDRAAATASFQNATDAAEAIEEPSRRVYSLEDIAVAQIESGNPTSALATMRKALKAADSLLDLHERNTARMWIVRTFARAGDVDTAIRIVDELPDGQPYKGQALANIMEGVARTGKPALNQFMTRFLNKASAIPDPGQQAECMEAAAQVLGEVGDADSLLKIARRFDKAVSAVGPQSPLRGSLLHSQVFVLSACQDTGQGGRPRRHCPQLHEGRRACQRDANGGRGTPVGATGESGPRPG